MPLSANPVKRRRQLQNLRNPRVRQLRYAEYCFNHGRRGCESCTAPVPIMRCGYVIACGRHAVVSCKECRASKRIYGPKRRAGRAPGEVIRAGSIANAPLRELVLREMRFVPELTFEEIGMRAGYFNSHVRADGTKAGDSSQVQRALGLKPDGGACRVSITEEAAVRIARAIHLDPWEIGL